MAGENINRRLNIYINDREVVNSMSGVTRAIAQTRNELRALVRGTENYDSEVTRLTSQLRTLSESQSEFREELQLTNNEMGAASENFSNLLGGLATGDMNAVQTSLMGIRGSIVATTQAAWAFVATPIGAAVAALVGIGLAAKEVADFNESIKESNQLLDNLGVDTKIRPAIQGLVDTYKVGFEDLAGAIDNMVDLELVKNEFEALEKIKEGLLKAPDKNAFLATLDANGIAAKNLGLQLEDVIALNESFEASGANAEAVFGSLQKASSTLILQSPQLKKSLENSFGSSFTNELLTKVRTGSITYYDALNLIHKKGEEIGLSNQKQAQLAKDLFGKSSIAAGGYEMILGNVTAAQSKQTQALTETQKKTQKLAESNIELAEAQDRALKLDGYNRWKNNALLAINKVKTVWYEMVSGLFNNEDDIKKASQAKGEANRLKDEEATFNDYMSRRQKRLGANFDWEKEKAEHLADVVKRMNANWNTDEEQKSFDLQISVIKNSKNPNAKKSKDDGATEADTKTEETAAKKREKELADAKKHSDDLLKQLEASKKEFLATERTYDDLKLANQKDGYDKELALLNQEFERKKEDAKIKVAELQTEINKLNGDAKDPKNTKSDIAVIKATIANKISAQKEYSASLVSLEEARNIKLGTLQEKYLEKGIQKQQDENSKALQNLQTKQNNELSSIKTLEDAKAILSQTLSEDELNQINNLDKAKKKLKEQHLKEEYDLQMSYLNSLVKDYGNLLNGQSIGGLKIITDEERDRIIKNLDEVQNKISELNLKGDGTEKKGTKEDGLKTLSGLDILGSSPEQWDAVFNNLSTAEAKLQAVTAVVGGLQNAFGMYFQFVAAGEARNLQKYQKATDLKKKALQDQLDRGAISQDLYNARVAKIDSDLAKKKAEIEYKQAKRQKAIQAAQIISSTALSIMGIWAQVPKFDFGISAGILTGVVGALGAAQLGLVLAQPLPDKNGFKKGGYTGNGPNTGEAGPAHFREYVIPENVLFSNDPVVPNIVGYLEQKRTGKQPEQPQETSVPINNAQSGSASTQDNSATTILLNRAVDVLEKLEENGFVGYLVNDIPSAKKMRDKIKELTKLETKQKA